MKPISLNEYLSIKNPLTERLLGYSSSPNRRDKVFVEKLYDEKIWGGRYEKFSGSPESLKESILSYGDSTEVTVSLNESLFKTSVNSFQAYTTSILESAIRKYAEGTQICELGCGIGTNLLRLSNLNPSRRLYGGELAMSGVKLGQLMGLDVCQFDYYSQESYSMIREDSTVLTVHSIEQIPDATEIINNLAEIRSKVNQIIHFEPVDNPSRTNLFGLLRNRYKEINDYNRNLREVLKSRDDVRILHEEFDLYGLNPLNPTSIIVWEFVQ